MGNTIQSYIESATRFEKSRDSYYAAREEQWQLLRDYFQARSDFRVSCGTAAGRGKRTYGSGDRLIPPYDLSNWRWLEITHIPSQLIIFLSLQPFDIDPSSGNLHVLYDRIGIYVHSAEKKTRAEALQKLMITDLSLPMDEKKLGDLEILIHKLIHTHAIWEQEGLHTRLV